MATISMYSALSGSSRTVCGLVAGHPRARFPGAEPPPEFLRIGIQFSDGSSVANVGGHAVPRSDALPASPILIADGGGGGGRRYDQRFWVWPLPPTDHARHYGSPDAGSPKR